MTRVRNRAVAARRVAPGGDTALDNALFVFSGAAALWLASILFEASLDWSRAWFAVVFWAALAYLVLPRLHRILTRIYLPDYFIGRARTSDGLLGDPVNVALLGSPAQVHTAMRRAGWTLADPVDLASSRRIITATLTCRSYDEAPVSPLFLFGRQQDFAYQQEVDGNPGKRHHIRFWRCPPGWVLPGGAAVDWVAAGTYDRSVGLSLFTLQVTHKIEEDIDRERDFVLASLRAADPAVGVRILRDFSSGYHSRNGGGDTISTDGHLPVVDLTGVTADAGAVPPPAVTAVRPPAPTLFGVGLAALRGLAALTLAALMADSDPGSLPLADRAGEQLPVVVAVIAVFGLAELALGWFVLRGGNRARVATMLLSALAIIAQAVDVLTGGPAVTFQTNLVGLSLDILLIIALTSRRSLSYARKADGQGSPSTLAEAAG
ncbi:LssY C-terminal domain-containing protein [Arthrobacter sp. NPDC057259]|uniref:LssY C-terminal domain-containing protein n=1 Tax=Arthrobacter sp. NPDC057259 TaxID=3346073 RepID=UPI003624DF2E